jgi:Ca-activated chloride channel homolog
VYQETKGFVIDSKPPQLTAKTSTAIGHAGETVEVTVAADRDTRRIAARLFGALPVRVAWDDKRKTNIGTLRIPPGLPSGKYTIVVTGEDFAHNVTSIEIPLEIVGG